MNTLDFCLSISASWAVAALIFQHLQVKAFGKRVLFAKPAGDPTRGAVYAFTKGMLPWAKESVRMNPASYAAGMTFHAGVFTAFLLLASSIFEIWVPYRLLVALRILLLAGGLAGLALLGKRLLQPQLRGLSNVDDFVSNLLSTLFTLFAFAATFSLSLLTAWKVEAILLLIYLPLGKIRHCFFFFTTRYHLGAFFGRRGTFPPSETHHG